MKLDCEKLRLAHALLVDWLSHGPQPVASCIAWAMEAGLSQRTVYEARRRMQIVCDRQPKRKGRPGEWRLIDVTPAPEVWNPRKRFFFSTEKAR